jgi:hypothetical protein
LKKKICDEKRVNLNRATSSSIKDYTDSTEANDGIQLKEVKQLQDNIINESLQSDKEDAIIQWQTKMFSKVTETCRNYIRNEFIKIVMIF